MCVCVCACVYVNKERAHEIIFVRFLSLKFRKLSESWMGVTGESRSFFRKMNHFKIQPRVHDFLITSTDEIFLAVLNRSLQNYGYNS